MKKFLRVVKKFNHVYIDMSESTSETIDPNWQWEYFTFEPTNDSDGSFYIKNNAHSKYISMDLNGVLTLVDTTSADCKFLEQNGGISSATHRIDNPTVGLYLITQHAHEYANENLLRYLTLHSLHSNRLNILEGS